MRTEAELLEASKSWTQQQRERRRAAGLCAYCDTPSDRYACFRHRVTLAAQMVRRRVERAKRARTAA